MQFCFDSVVSGQRSSQCTIARYYLTIVKWCISILYQNIFCIKLTFLKDDICICDFQYPHSYEPILALLIYRYFKTLYFFASQNIGGGQLTPPLFLRPCHSME